jgi:hypothetical protein
VDRDFDSWVAALHLDEPDEGGDVGMPLPGRIEFLREIFDAHGPVPPTALGAAWSDREVQLARRGVELFTADLRRTTALAPSIEVRVLNDGVITVTYNGNYQAPALFSIRDPEAICEVAENLRDHVVDDLWTVWPSCPQHGSGLDPQPLAGQPVWFCRRGDHSVSRIGELRSPQ